MSEDHLFDKIELLVNIFDVLPEHLNKDLRNIFILAICPIDDWLWSMKLIIEADDLIVRPICFMLLIFISETLMATRLTTTYWYGKASKSA